MKGLDADVVVDYHEQNISIPWQLHCGRRLRQPGFPRRAVTVRSPLDASLPFGLSADRFPLSSVLRFDVTCRVWEELVPMPTARDYFAAARAGKHIYTASGTDCERVRHRGVLLHGLWRLGDRSGAQDALRHWRVERHEGARHNGRC